MAASGSGSFAFIDDAADDGSSRMKSEDKFCLTAYKEVLPVSQDYGHQTHWLWNQSFYQWQLRPHQIETLLGILPGERRLKREQL